MNTQLSTDVITIIAAYGRPKVPIYLGKVVSLFYYIFNDMIRGHVYSNILIPCFDFVLASKDVLVSKNVLRLLYYQS